MITPIALVGDEDTVYVRFASAPLLDLGGLYWGADLADRVPVALMELTNDLTARNSFVVRIVFFLPIDRPVVLWLVTGVRP